MAKSSTVEHPEEQRQLMRRNRYSLTKRVQEQANATLALAVDLRGRGLAEMAEAAAIIGGRLNAIAADMRPRGK
jgi:hypothetical protein